MSRNELHNWESAIERLCPDNSEDMMKIAKDIYDTAFARGRNQSSWDDEISKENVWNNKKPSTSRIGFNIDDIDSLSDTAALIFENKLGTAELFVGGESYLVLQHDLNRSVKEQSFDVFSIEETLGKQVSFNDMIRMIKDDIAQHIQIGR